MNKEYISHAPIIYMDKKEPFKIKRVGVSVYDADGEKSRSFNRKFDFGNFEGACKVVEYAYYLDYDIQHLYDLEHIWVYLDKNGEIAGAEGSYHGRFLNALNKSFGNVDDENRIVMYSQPGKHAMVADPKIMYLYTELFTSCERLAGISGLDAPEKFLEQIHISDDDNRKVMEHIRNKYSFRPSMEFEKAEIPEECYVTWDELEKEIPEFIKKELDMLGIRYF